MLIEKIIFIFIECGATGRRPRRSTFSYTVQDYRIEYDLHFHMGRAIVSQNKLMTIEIFRDTWGIPHLRASNERELAFAQGLNAAHDRAFQIEVERHRSRGTSAAFLGAEAVPWDRFARQTRLDDTAQRCFHKLEPETRAWLGAYVDGVNTGLANIHSSAFARCGLAPGRFQPWTPLGIWLSIHILFAGFPTKLWRDAVARTLGDHAIELFSIDSPSGSGSNGWLIPGDLTRSGAAILAGDPHRFIEVPGVYQQIRLSCPQYDVVGLAVPGVPGIAHFGHAGTVAWAITNAMADYQDLYREQLRRRAEQVEARGPEGFGPAHRHVETIEVSDGPDIDVEIIETERGPVVIDGGDDGPAVSLRYPSRVWEDLGFDALPRLLRAKSVADVDRALDRWVEPINVVQAADSQGGLLYRVAGRVPVRDHDNRFRIVPAWEPAHAWRGVHDPLPRAAVEGVSVMANQRGLAAALGSDFVPPHRAKRIRQLLGASTRWSAADMAAIHMDTYLAAAEVLLTLLADLSELGPEAERLRQRLLSWDRRMDAESRDAALYAAFRAALVQKLSGHPMFAPLALLVSESCPYPEIFHPFLALVPRVAFALERLLDSPMLPERDRREAVRAAIEDVAAAGAPSATWGELHRLAPWQARPDTSREPWPGLAGDYDCVCATYSIPGITHHSTRGPAARYVWDLVNREHSLWIVPLGAAGEPDHRHHCDQLPLWLRGELVPIVTDWNALRREMTLEASSRPGDAVYVREEPGFGTLRIVPIVPETDLDLIYGWVTQERARFWGMLDHSRDDVLEIYQYLASLSTHHAYLVYRDDQPVALFQTYEPAADPVGHCYEVQPGDFGIHFMMAPPIEGPQPGFTGRVLSVAIAYALENPEVQRIVVEPDARNDRAIARFVRASFELGPEIELPEKRARLAFLHRIARRYDH